MFGGVGLRLGLVDRAVGMLRRRVERVELDLPVPRVDHVVPDTGRHYEGPVVLDLVCLINRILGSTEFDTGLTLLETDELVVGAE